MQNPPDPADPEHGLFARAGSGDEAALARLVALYRERLLARIRRMMGPAGRACLESGDVLHDVLAEAIAGLRAGALRDERAFLRWVTAIARHRIVDEVRQRRPRSLEALSSELAAGAPSLTARLSAAETRARLHEALDALDPERQRVVELRAFEGRNWRTIARELGRSEEAARKLYHRALIALGERLAGEHRSR